MVVIRPMNQVFIWVVSLYILQKDRVDEDFVKIPDHNDGQSDHESGFCRGWMGVYF